MATIQASIKLTDGMTPALQSMNRALNIVLNSFEQMQKVSGKAIDTKEIQAARQELARAQVSFNNIEKEIIENKKRQDQFNSSVRQGTGAANGLWSKLKSIAGIYLGFQSVKGLINLSDETAQTQARLNLVTGSLEKTKQLQDKIYAAAQRSRGSYLDMADSVAKLSLNTGDLFRSNDETIKFMETLNKMFVVSGVKAEQAGAAMLQLTQALGSGVLQGDEYTSIGENATMFKDILADYLNVSTGQLKKMAAEGKLTAEVVRDAMLDATSRIEDKFNSMNMTWGQVWIKMKNFAIKQAEPILEKINQIVNSERFASFSAAVCNAIRTVIIVAGGLFDVIMGIVTFIYDNWTFIEAILIGLATAYIPTIIGLLKAKAIALWACVKPWLIMNWKILVVAAVIAGLIILANYLGITFADVCGFIAGCFEMVGAVIWNIILAIYNVIVTVVGAVVISIWNAFQFIANVAIGCCQWVVNAWNWCCENIGTVFHNIGVWWDNLWIDARIGFYSFINDVLSKLASLAAKIQPLAKLFDIDLSGMISGAQASVGGKIANLEASRRQAKSHTSMKKTNWDTYAYTNPENVISKYTADYVNLGDAFNNGFKNGSTLGDEIGTRLKNLFTGKNFTEISGEEYAALADKYGAGNVDKYGNIADGVGGKGANENSALNRIADNTSKIAGNTSDLATSKEDLTYMRDLAEQEAINRYTMTDLKIEMNNNNNISSDIDIDYFIGKVQEKVYEGVLATAEGLHF